MKPRVGTHNAERSARMLPVARNLEPTDDPCDALDQALATGRAAANARAW